MATSSISRGPFKVAIVVGSQRIKRIGPQVSQFVLDVVQNHHQQSLPPEIVFSTLDIAKFNLPLTDEPGMPVRVQDRPDGYATEPTRVWSKAVADLDAFVFVTPQYNWGIPAGLKNAIDHLFHEWAGKPAAVVSYGGHGGGMSAAALITVLAGLGMRVVKEPVQLKYPAGDIKAFLPRAVAGEDLGLDARADEGLWGDRRHDIVQLSETLAGLLRDKDATKPASRSLGLAEVWQKVWEDTANAEKAAASKS